MKHLFLLIFILSSGYVQAQDTTALTPENSSQFAAFQARNMQLQFNLSAIQYDSVKLIYKDYYYKVSTSDKLQLSDKVRKDYLQFLENLLISRLRKNLTATQWELKTVEENRLRSLADSLQQAEMLKRNH